MTNSRVSNKQILDAILGLTEAIRGQNAVTSAPVIDTPEVPSEPSQIKVSKEYLGNRKVAAQAHANKVGGTVVLYARRNLSGETKLAFAQESRFTTLKDRGLIGPVATYQPK
jgi:hypothetical protein